MMHELPVKHPELYSLFMSGGHVARRRSRVWSGLPTDLTIEQTTITIKGRGGLTQGRGVTESARTLWVSSVYKTTTVKSALDKFVN